MSSDISNPPNSFSSKNTKIEISVVSVATSVGQLVRNRPNRLALQVSNMTASHVYISPRRTVSTTEAIFLQSGGGFYSINVREDGNLPELEWHALGAGVVNVLVIEVLRINGKGE